MAKDPAFLFYSSDFLMGVSDLTMEERGQYITILCIQHQKGRLTRKSIGIAVPNATADVMAKFSIDEDGLYYNERLEKEAIKRSEHAEKQRQRALSGWRKRKATADDTALPLEDKSVIEDVSIDKEESEVEVEICPTFEEFWNLYDHKINAKKVRSKWGKLKQAEKEQTMLHVPLYVQSTPNKTFRTHPLKYLNNEGWNDEIIRNNGLTKAGKSNLTEEQERYLVSRKDI